MRLGPGLIAVCAAAALLIACTGDSGDATPTASATPTAVATVLLDPTPDLADEFAQVLARLDGGEHRIQYTFTSVTADEEFVGSLTWIRATDGRERFETTSEQSGEGFRLVVIVAADGERITCFEVGGFSDCFRGEEGPFAEIPNPTEIIFQNVLDPSAIDEVRETSSREILGVEATCYEVAAAGGTSEACIGEGNRLLSASWTAANGDGGSFEAVEFSTEVSDVDFEPIVPVAD